MHFHKRKGGFSQDIGGMNIPTVILNPNVPLDCEHNGKRKPALLGFCAAEGTYYSDGPTFFPLEQDISKELKSCFSSEKHMQAQREAIKAYDLDTETAIQKAREALAICDETPDAFSALAQRAKSLDEAAELYRKGVEVGPKQVKESVFQIHLQSHNIWGCIALRGYYRCVHGLANTLRKMKKYEEAWEWYQNLMLLDEHVITSSGYINARVNVPEVLLGLKKYDECSKFLEENEKFGMFESSLITWTYTTSLLTFRKHGESKTTVEEIRKAILCSKEVASVMLDLNPFPANWVEPYSLSSIKENSLSYIKFHKQHWEAVPGALEYLSDQIFGAIDDGNKDEVENWIEASKIDLTSVQTIIGNHLHAAVYAGHYEIAKLLIEKYKVPIGVKTVRAQSLVYMSSYHGFFDITKLLIQHGADPSIQDLNRTNALHIAANQGNWKILDYLIERFPELLAIENGEGKNLLEIAVTSTVAECMRGGLECPKHELGFSHGPDTDCEKTAIVCLKRGSEFNRQDSQGYTPLHWAAGQKMPLLIRELLKMGAKRNLRCIPTGETALNVAQRQDPKIAAIFHELMSEDELLPADLGMKYKQEGNSHFKSRNYQKAIEFYDKAIIQFTEAQLTNEITLCHSNKSLCFEKLGEFQKSIDSCNKALKINPKLTKALYRKALCFNQVKKVAPALYYVNLALQVDNTDPTITSLKAELEAAWNVLPKDGKSYCVVCGEVAEKEIKYEDYHAVYCSVEHQQEDSEIHKEFKK